MDSRPSVISVILSTVSRRVCIRSPKSSYARPSDGPFGAATLSATPRP